MRTSRRGTTKLLLVVGFALAVAKCSQRPLPMRVFVDGPTLVAENDQRSVLKELGLAAEVQGYGSIRDNLLFVAWSSETDGGASTLISLFQLATAKEHFLCELGGTGETEFAVNERTGVVAFNWRDAVYLTRASDLLAVRDRTTDCAALERRFVKVLQCESCYELRWVSRTRLSYRGSDRGAAAEVDLSRVAWPQR